MISTFQQLCPVCFGAGAVSTIGEKAKEFGGSKALVIYDMGVKMTGAADRIAGYLSEAGLEYVLCDRVMPEAPDEVINEIGASLRGQGIDIVIGIGGGSSLDTAKSVSVLCNHEPPISQYYAENGGTPFVNQSVKLILVPTAAGTGSEVTIMSVVHDSSEHIKKTILRPADLAIVDPELTLTLPPAVTAMTGIDAMSHAVEAYTSATPNPHSDLLALKAITLIRENVEKAVFEGSDIEARTNMALASNFAGISFSDASVHFGHCAAHEFGAVFHVPHGLACAIALPEVIVFAADVLPERTIEIAKALGIDTAGMSAAEAAEAAADDVRKLMKRIGIKSLKDLGFSREDAVAAAEGAVKNYWFIIRSPGPVDVEKMKELIGKMYDNYQ